MSAFSDSAKQLHKQLSSHLRTLRKDKGLTMRALSQNIGTPHSFIGKIENQDRRLDVAEFILYCEGMELDPAATFSEMLAITGKTTKPSGQQAAS